MSAELQGKRIAVLAADGVERVELEQPRDAAQEAGAEVELLSINDGEIQGSRQRPRPSGTFRRSARRSSRSSPKGVMPFIPRAPRSSPS